MRAPLPILLATALLGLGGVGCGSSKTAITAASDSASSARSTIQSTAKPDRDDDGDNNNDDSQTLEYGHEATAAERPAILAVLRRYYAAAAAADGAKACALLAPFIAESVVQENGHRPELRGSSCSAVMSKLFRHSHTLLSAENATLKVLTVRVQGGKALIVSHSSALREVRQITERRIGGRWTVLELLDGIIE